MESPNINQNPMPNFHILPRLEALGGLISRLVGKHTTDENRGATVLLDEALES